MTQTRKMTNLKVVETSGVDHPAHLHEGWLVMKSASAENVADLFGSLNKPEEAPVAENENGGTQEQAPATITLTQEELDAKIAEAVAAAAPAPVVEETAPVTGEGELEKALSKMPEPLRKAFAKQAEDLARATEAIAKERDARLDEQAIAKSKDLFKSIAIDHSAVAPALRRFAAENAEVAKAIETALSAADAQLAAGTTLTKEVGKAGEGDVADGAVAAINKAAAALREADPSLTDSQAFAKAVTSDPELYKAYAAEKAGK